MKTTKKEKKEKIEKGQVVLLDRTKNLTLSNDQYDVGFVFQSVRW
jgi:hypothetical protein